MSAPSLKRRMLIILLGMFTAVWMSVATVTYMNVKREVRSMFDAQLSQAANVLAIVMRDEVAELNATGATSTPYDIPIHDMAPEFMFQVIVDDKVIIRSPNAPLTAIIDAPGYKSLDVDDNPWRILRYEEENNPAAVIVGGQRTERSRLVQNVALESMWPLLVALPMLALVTLLGVRQALLPLRRVKHDIRRRSPDDLAPVDTKVVPKEISQVITAMNALFKRLADALERERRFTSYAAHELRTPLAALKTQAHVAITARDEAVRKKAVENISIGVERTSKLVDQLMTLARLEPAHTKMRHDRVDFATLARDIVEGIRPAAVERKIDLTIKTADDACVEGDYTTLSVLVRNLVDNAIRYSPEGGQVVASVFKEKNNVILTVSDTGAGIPEEERQAVFESFYRIVGNKADGVGLGLSIAKRITELHQGAIELTNRPQGGLMVTVRIPRKG